MGAHAWTFLLILIVLSQPAAVATTPCDTELDCSLNGACIDGVCHCDKPWGGRACGVLQYKRNQPLSAKDLYPFNNTAGPLKPCVNPPHYTCDALNTWNGPIVGPVNGKYHMYNPLYKKGSLIQTTAMLHGVATNITGPYEWEEWPNMGSNPAAVQYTDESGDNKFALFAKGVRVASSPDGPFADSIGDSPGGNPAPLRFNDVWYATTQTTTEVVTTSKLGQPWTHYSNITPKLSGYVRTGGGPGVHQEDPCE